MKLSGRCARFAQALLAAVGLAAGAVPAAAEFSPDQKIEIGKVVRDYLIANPEVIKDAIDELEKRQKIAEAASRAKAVTQKSAALFNSQHQTVVGNPAGDVTIVEFFDYNCGYCKQALNTVGKLIDADPKIKVILKDFPILGSDSVEAATVAAAIREQFKGAKYWDFHKKLLGVRGHVGKTQAVAIAKELGADVDKLEKDMKDPSIQAGFKEVEALAEDLKFNGTPSWVVGEEAVVGGLPYAELKQKVDNVRKCGKTSC